MIKKWANANLENVNCENVGIFIRNDIIPKIYNMYLSEENDSGDEPLSLEDFLKLFRLKNVSNSTVWRWMSHIGFIYDERKKINSVINTRLMRISLFEKNLPRNILRMNFEFTDDGCKYLKI